MINIASAVEAVQLEQYKSLIIGIQGDQVTNRKQSDKDAPGILWGFILDYLRLGCSKFNNDLKNQIEKRRLQHILAPFGDVVAPDIDLWKKLVELFPCEPSDE